MTKTRPEKPEHEGQPHTIDFAYLLRPSNRGLLLDLVVFIVNLFLIQMLLRQFLSVLRAASNGEPVAQVGMFLFFVALFVFPPLGATLKRWHYHRRLRLKGKSVARDEDFMGGCLFNPIFYFCLNIVVFSAINAFILQYVYGNREPSGGVFVSSILIGLVLTILHTFLVYRFFSPPKREPRAIFLRDPRSEIVGDVFIFVTMLCYQLVWSLLTLADIGRVSSISEFFGRLFILIFIALLVYFPPRIFYLADDIKKRRTWFTILLANAPIIYRLMIGTGSNAGW